MKQKDSKIKVGIKLTPEVHTKMKVFCVKNEIKMHDFIEEAIKMALKVKD